MNSAFPMTASISTNPQKRESYDGPVVPITKSFPRAPAREAGCPCPHEEFGVHPVGEPRVRLFEGFPVDEDGFPPDLHRVARQADDALE